MPSQLNQRYNRKKDKLTGNEHKFGIEHHTIASNTLPSSFDLRTAYPSVVPPILNQSSIGSCVDNEVSNALRFCVGRETGVKSEWQPSRLFLYYNARVEDGSPTNQDTGSSLLACFKGVKQYGVCSELNWPYIISKFTLKPSQPCYTAAKTHCPEFQFLQVPQDLTHIKQALVAGYPIVIGIQVYSSFESDQVAKTGQVPMPNTSTEELLGGHSVSIVKYDDSTQTFTLSNSWGGGWGQEGYFTLPYQYVLDSNLCDSLFQARYFK